MPDSQLSSPDGPYNLRRSPEAKDKAEIQSFRTKVAALEAELQELRAWKDNLQGQNGVVVSGGVINFDPAAVRPRIGGSSQQDTMVAFYVVINGTLVPARIHVTLA
jgi:hypothetical protein